MAKVLKNTVVEGLSGRLGGQIVFRQFRDGRTVAAQAPDFSRRVLSAGQKAHHARFKDAAAYAKSAARLEVRYAQLAAGSSKTAYNLALADYFQSPVIHEVTREGQRLLIHATDTVWVAQVTVRIVDQADAEREAGEAVRLEDDLWEYVFSYTGRAEVEARDLAGNVTTSEVSIK